MTPGTYRINEIFYSIQGEGVRAGTANVFVRFSKCNMACDLEPGPKSPGGFSCDTEFESGQWMTLDEIGLAIRECLAGVTSGALEQWEPWLILTGGEPALQVDLRFCDFFHKAGFKLAIETNGSIELPAPVGPVPAWRGSSLPMSEREKHLDEALAYYPLDWITVSPKVAEHAIRQRYAHEVKYVRGKGQGLPQTQVLAKHYLISPALEGWNDWSHREIVGQCAELVERNPRWRLSVQLHKGWGVR